MNDVCATWLSQTVMKEFGNIIVLNFHLKLILVNNKAETTHKSYLFRSILDRKQEYCFLRMHRGMYSI